ERFELVDVPSGEHDIVIAGEDAGDLEPDTARCARDESRGHPASLRIGEAQHRGRAGVGVLLGAEVPDAGPHLEAATRQEVDDALRELGTDVAGALAAG